MFSGFPGFFGREFGGEEGHTFGKSGGRAEEVDN